MINVLIGYVDRSLYVLKNTRYEQIAVLQMSVTIVINERIRKK